MLLLFRANLKYNRRIVDLQSRVKEKDQIIEELQEQIARRARSGRPSPDKSESDGHTSKEESPTAPSPGEFGQLYHGTPF